MDNLMEKKIETEMGARVIQGFYCTSKGPLEIVGGPYSGFARIA